MLKKICSLFVWVTIIFTAGLLPAVSQKEQAEKILRVETGTYKIMQVIGQDTTAREVGSESYTKTTYSTNTVVVEGEAVLDLTVISPASGKITSLSRLEIEEDSFFPRRYHTIRTSKGPELELSVEMVSNIAIVTRRYDDRTEKEEVPVSTGAMFVEGSFVHHRALLLHRFTSSVPGKQNVIVFDPQLKKESTAVIEFVGEEPVEIDGTVTESKLYKVTIEKLAEMKLYVDDKGIVVKASTGAQDFILTSFEENTGENPAGG